jgi:hypothetical protein
VETFRCILGGLEQAIIKFDSKITQLLLVPSALKGDEIGNMLPVFLTDNPSVINIPICSRCLSQSEGDK